MEAWNGHFFFPVHFSFSNFYLFIFLSYFYYFFIYFCGGGHMEGLGSEWDWVHDMKYTKIQ